MKKLFIALMSVCAVAFTSCEKIDIPITSTNYASKEKLIIVAGSHENSYQPDWKLIEDKIVDACEKNAEIQLIIEDGKPFVQPIDLAKIDTSLSKQNQKKKAEENAVKVLTACQTTKAKTSEVNTFASISLAERCIDSKAKNEVIVISSMLPTTGKINFAETPLFSLDTESSAKAFENSLDFHGAEVSVYGIGEVAEPQETLSDDDYSKLVDFWEIFFENQNCDVHINKSPYTNRKEPDISLPDVSVCLVGENVNGIHQIKDGVIYELTSEISFMSDSAEFADKEEAKEKLLDFAEKLNEDDKLVLCGMTATHGDAESSEALSLYRAESVKKLLQEIGVTSEITCVGTGFINNAFHTPDLNADGTLNEQVANRNRTVIAMTENTAKKYELI